VKNALVTAESHIRTPENANTVLGAGQADLVSIVRGQIADPHLVAKAEAGRDSDIRGCISCNQQCWGRRSRDYYISCLINPSAGHEYLWGGDRFTASDVPQSVLVVGGGPAGLEAARVAAERGHRVTLAEAGPDLGGQFRLAGLQPRRGQITDLLAWYQRQLTQLGVDLRFNTYLDADDIAAFGADHVILATGSLPAETGFQKALPHHATLPGLHHGKVWSVEDVMRRDARPGPHVIVLDEGGNWRGCGTAWRLAEDGHKVTLVTPDALVGKELQRSATDWPLRRALALLGVTFRTDAAIDAWTGEGADLRCLLTGRVERLEADALVLATTNLANVDLRRELAARGINATLIGDANTARNAAYATFEGRKLALAL
jgi:NADPH-dependent 2,4-dienoyl-CoA reductase/sulfur reductase-like enzyme